jgi:hypothetical protein
MKIKGARALDELAGPNNKQRQNPTSIFYRERTRKSTTKASAMDQDTEQKESPSYTK